MYGLLGSDIWPRYNYLKIWNLRVQNKKRNIEKITFKVVQIKFLAMHIIIIFFFFFFFFFIIYFHFLETTHIQCHKDRIYKRKLKHQTPLAVTLYMDKNIKALY